MNEKWKQIPGYKNYEASSFGRIRSLDYKIYRKNRWGVISAFHKTGKILKTKIKPNGYGFVSLHNNKEKPKYFHTHRLVAMTFLGKSKLQVNHINGIKLDNRLQNLEYVTSKQNIHHSIKNGLIKNTNSGVPFLTKDEIKAIRFFYVKGRGGTSAILGKIFNRHKSQIKRIAMGMHCIARDIDQNEAHGF